jgi:soluble lytic murein transglycosylase
MSSMTRRLRTLASLSGLASALLALPFATTAQNLMAPPPRPSLPTVNDSALSAAISEWNGVRQTDALPFSSYARFLIAHPGWPGEAALRKSAERALRTDAEDPQLVAAYFGRYAPTTATSALRQAEALDGIGRRDDARAAARRAWTLGVLSPDDEQRLLTRFPGALALGDQDLRMERLLAVRATSVAVRQLSLTSPQRQPIYDTRIAMQSKTVDAANKVALVASSVQGDPGFLLDRITWLRTTGQEQTARALLSQPRRLSVPPLDPGKWFETLIGAARAAAADGQYQTAYDIARQVDDAYAAGTVVRDRPIGERDNYTNLTWLAGTTALNRLGRPADAVIMFDRYARAARSPQTQSKGLYWAGRAAEAARRSSDAQSYYANAAQFFDQFYGQLATERLGRAPTIPAVSTTIEISRNQREAFYDREIVRAAQILGMRGDHQTQSLFVRQIAQAAESDLDHALAVELSQRMQRPDLGVMIGRSAGINGLRDYVRAGFPTVPVPVEAASSWTMVHAISRQESQFDRAAVSRTGARGLMQLMPGTARDTAVKIGATYDLGGLTGDTQYNIKLGSWFFGRLMDRYNGNYVLAVAAYNAGPGNVNKWIAANGDPRLPGVDVLQWIEAIPFSETRGYVQRVLENAVVYDLIDPEKARVRSRTPLSMYLGKSMPG